LSTSPALDRMEEVAVEHETDVETLVADPL
jgi:hypothetical protein